MVGEAPELVGPLLRALVDGQFSERPFLAVEVAKFCAADDLYRDALTAAFVDHHKVSALGAEIWRDVVVLRPALQREVSSLIPTTKEASALWRHIDVRVEGRIATVLLSDSLYRAVLDRGPAIFPEFDLLARAFGVYEIHVRIRQSPGNRRREALSYAGANINAEDRADGAAPNVRSLPRHFMYLREFEASTLRQILVRARKFKQDGDRSRPLAGKTLAMVLERPSSHARVSFEVAMRQLGGDVIVLPGRLEFEHERQDSLADIGRTLSNYVDAIMLVTPDVSRLHALARYSAVPVINGVVSTSHPCQLLADILTFEERIGPIAGQIVAWCGDGSNVARSWIEAAVRFGFRLRLATPDALRPPAELIEWALAQGSSIELTSEPAEAVAGAHCVVTDTWASVSDDPRIDRYNALAPFRVTAALMSKAAAGAIFMHPLPAHRGEEVTADVFDGPQSVVFDEAENRMHVRKSVLAWVLGSSRNDDLNE